MMEIWEDLVRLLKEAGEIDSRVRESMPLNEDREEVAVALRRMADEMLSAHSRKSAGSITTIKIGDYEIRIQCSSHESLWRKLRFLLEEHLSYEECEICGVFRPCLEVGVEERDGGAPLFVCSACRRAEP